MQELTNKLEALTIAINATTLAVNAHGETEIERLQDVLVRVQEIALHGVRHGAAGAACAELRNRADLSNTLSPNFVEEHGHENFGSLRDDFASLGEAVAQVTLAKDIINKVFLSP